MTPEEAIERLTDETVQLRHGFSPKWVEAVQLGIEALKFYEGARETIKEYSGILLPGETKE